MTEPLTDHWQWVKVGWNDKDEVHAYCSRCGWKGPDREWVREAYADQAAHSTCSS